MKDIIKGILDKVFGKKFDTAPAMPTFPTTPKPPTPKKDEGPKPAPTENKFDLDSLINKGPEDQNMLFCATSVIGPLLVKGKKYFAALTPGATYVLTQEPKKTLHACVYIGAVTAPQQINGRKPDLCFDIREDDAPDSVVDIPGDLEGCMRYMMTFLSRRPESYRFFHDLPGQTMALDKVGATTMCNSVEELMGLMAKKGVA